MDVATHVLLPMAGALAALGFARRGEPADRARAAVAATFGLAGGAPDIDGILDFLSERSDALYFMQHRGVSHSLLGAPLFGIALALALAAAARAWPRRFGLFVWRPALLPAAALGSLTHLVLDAVTYSGVPLLWPFSFGRFGFPIFHWVVFWLLLPAGAALVLHAAGRLSRRSVVLAGVGVLAVLVVLAGVRATTRPDAEDGSLVFPRRSEFEWTILRPLPNGTWEASLVRGSATLDLMWFEPSEPPESAGAVEAARATDAYKGFLMGSFGPVIVQAREGEAGAWTVSFVDVAQRFEALHEPRWSPAKPFESWGVVAFVVEDGVARATQRGW